MLNLNFFVLKYVLFGTYCCPLRVLNKTMASIQSCEVDKVAEVAKKEAKEDKKEAKKAKEEKKAARKAFQELRKKYQRVYCGGIGIPPSVYNIAEICNECKERVISLYRLGYNRENSNVMAAEDQYEMIRQCADALVAWKKYRGNNE